MSIETSRNSAVDAIALDIFRSRMQGEVMLPGSERFDQVRRIYNVRFNNTPAVIARCATASDVAQAVLFAREHDLEIAVRSGGHSLPGFSTGDNVMMIDLAGMRKISIDPQSQTARIQMGANNGEVVLAAQAHGLATTTGTCATVGMGGSTLGGGIGWLMGRFGMTIDNVLECEVVTAEGDVIVANANQHSDLFWALRGGGGNFGVVTTVTYKLHKLGTVLGGMALFHLAAAPLMLRIYRQVSQNAPDELITHAVMTTVPDFGPALIIQACYSGEDLEEGARVIAPLRRWGPPAVDLIAPRSYAEMYMMMTPPAIPGLCTYENGFSLQNPSDAALDDLHACATAASSPFSLVNIHQVHGAATRVAPEATAFALRQPHYSVMAIAGNFGGDGANEANWLENTMHRMSPHTSKGVYSNFMEDEGEQGVRTSFGANYGRLARIKRIYDPENIFHRNQNIRPA